MVRKTIVTLLLLLVAALPLSAELKYTSHVAVRKAGEATNPMFAGMAEPMMQAMAPGGSMDSTVYVGDKGMRIENNKATAQLPEGAVQFLRPDGSMIIMNPKDKTYWKMPIQDLSAIMAQMNPKITTKRTGEFATIIGMKAEKVMMDISMALPIPPGVELPPGMPTSLSMTAETWIADQYKPYAAMVQKGGNQMLASMGMKMPEGLEGITVKQVMRGDMFGGYEVETTITKIGEEKVDAAMFEIPKDYKEIPPPGIGGLRQ